MFGFSPFDIEKANKQHIFDWSSGQCSRGRASGRSCNKVGQILAVGRQATCRQAFWRLLQATWQQKVAIVHYAPPVSFLEVGLHNVCVCGFSSALQGLVTFVD